jgi:hypothetical protein
MTKQNIYLHPKKNKVLLFILSIIFCPDTVFGDSCWIHVPHSCAYSIPIAQWFQDDYFASSSNQRLCMQRAADYQWWCGTDGAWSYYASDSGAASWVYDYYGKPQAFYLAAGHGLPIDNYWSNPGGTLEMQGDGNLAIYQNGVPIWGTNSASSFSLPSGNFQYQTCTGTSCSAQMQFDGNLVLYNTAGPYWASSTNGSGYRLLLYPTTPAIMIVNSSNSTVWSSLSEPMGNVQNLNNQIRGGGSLLDFLISNVCVDAFDHPIPGDPYNCGNHRNIRIGEKIPYLVTDFDRYNNYATYQAMASMPVPGTDGTLKVMAVKNLQQNFNADFSFSFSLQRDGYDLIDIANSGYASFTRTSDGGCYDQVWSADGGYANRAGGWILFPGYDPYAFAPSSSANVTTYNIPISIDRPSRCQPGHSTGTTYWNSPQYYTFETGKTLEAVKSYHFASAAFESKDNALELYYFTKQYGFTRWEAWIPQSRCIEKYGSEDPICHPDWSSYPLAGRCWILNTSATGNPAMDTWGGQYWVRTDCRDETNYVALNRPQAMLDSTMAQNDGVYDLVTDWLYWYW